MTATTTAGPRVLRARDHRRMRWKNGLGETAEIAVSPPDAALDQFDWRVSMARVEAPGPFSAFPGVDRTLTVLDGRGIRLALDGRAEVELTPGSAPFPFSGDHAASATLLGGPVTDLNVMTRRDGLWHRVRRLAAEQRTVPATTGDAMLLLCASGSARVVCSGAAFELGALDALLVERPAATLEFAAGAAGNFLLIEIGHN